jgi:hypothetical protein
VCLVEGSFEFKLKKMLAGMTQGNAQDAVDFDETADDEVL